MKKILLILGCAAVLGVSGAETVRLWPGEAPLSKGTRDCDIPTLTVYLPQTASGAFTPAVVVCPGGAYSYLATAKEGTPYAEMLNKNGIAALVLKYRVGSANGGAYRYPAPQLDAQRAIRLVRANAKKWHIDANRVGIMGSSAGGHLTAMTAVKNDNGDPKNSDPVEHFSSRPDFFILCYGQTSMDKRYGECAGSRGMLLGDHAGSIEDVNACKLVNDDTPPGFIWHTFEDGSVPVRNALDLANAMEENMVPFSLHIYHSGAHGMGVGNPENYHPWVSQLMFWLKEIGVLR